MTKFHGAIEVLSSPYIRDIFISYVRASEAYRLHIKKVGLMMVDTYGELSVERHFNIDDINDLFDPLSDGFLDRMKISTFIKGSDNKYGIKILSSMYRSLHSDFDIRDFSRVMRAAQNHRVSDDVLFFIEHRIRIARIVIRRPVGVDVSLVSKKIGVLYA